MNLFILKSFILFASSSLYTKINNYYKQINNFHNLFGNKYLLINIFYFQTSICTKIKIIAITL